MPPMKSPSPVLNSIIKPLNMDQFSSVEEYDREAETQRRIKHNRKIDAIVKLSLKYVMQLWF